MWTSSGSGRIGRRCCSRRLLRRRAAAATSGRSDGRGAVLAGGAAEVSTRNWFRARHANSTGDRLATSMPLRAFWRERRRQRCARRARSLRRLFLCSCVSPGPNPASLPQPDSFTEPPKQDGEGLSAFGRSRRAWAGSAAPAATHTLNSQCDDQQLAGHTDTSAQPASALGFSASPTKRCRAVPPGPGRPTQLAGLVGEATARALTAARAAATRN